MDNDLTHDTLEESIEDDVPSGDGTESDVVGAINVETGDEDSGGRAAPRSGGGPPRDQGIGDGDSSGNDGGMEENDDGFPPADQVRHPEEDTGHQNVCQARTASICEAAPGA